MLSILFHHIILIMCFYDFFNVIQSFSFNDPTVILFSQIAQGRVRREPAVWGDPAPDYSQVALDGTTTYIYALLFVDSKITEYYNDDMLKVKREVTRMVNEANQYLFQLNIRIHIVDILPTMRSDLSLYSFEDYYNKRANLLPYHNFASLISYRYGGGLAFVSGMCSNKAVMLAGFYPHNPEAMGGIFFHEIAHLLGVPHSHPNETLDVANCACPKRTEEEYLSLTTTERKIGCLKIPGFDHDCTVQLMANFLYRNRCLPRELRTDERNRIDGYVEWSASSALMSICGNGIVEGDEQCDCGLQKYCREWNCDPNVCTNRVQKWIIILVIVVIIAIIVSAGTLYFYIRCGKSCSKFNAPKMGSKTNPSRILRALAEPLNYLKRLVFRRKNKSHNRPRNLVNSKRSIFLSNAKLDPSSIVVVRSCSNENVPQIARTDRIARPKMPPPPPPLTLKNSNHTRPARPPPPVFSSVSSHKPQTSQDYETPRPTFMQFSQPSISPEPPVSLRPHMETLLSPYSVDRYSISRKFEDFDDDDED